MRAIVVLALCALLSSVASAQTIATSQAEARALEERWANCSQIVHGRLGALHPSNLDESFLFTITPDPGHVNGTADFVQATYSPCEPMQLAKLQPTPAFVYINNGTIDYLFDMPTSAPIAQFSMPTAKGEVAKFTAVYRSTMHQRQITVVTQCSSETTTTLKDGVLTKDAKGDFVLTINNINACPRFPYSNKAMPAGGVAALVVLLVIFGMELLVCGWYHKTHTEDVMRDTTDQVMH